MCGSIVLRAAPAPAIGRKRASRSMFRRDIIFRAEEEPKEEEKKMFHFIGLNKGNSLRKIAPLYCSIKHYSKTLKTGHSFRCQFW